MHRPANDCDDNETISRRTNQLTRPLTPNPADTGPESAGCMSEKLLTFWSKTKTPTDLLLQFSRTDVISLKGGGNEFETDPA